jgi:hypothetical protein
MFRVAEQFEVAPPVRFPGAHVSEEITGTLMSPPAAVSDARALPVGSTPIALVIPSDVLPAFDANFTWITATAPSAIALVFRPLAMQVNSPGAEEHEIAFPAESATAPAVALMAET